MIPLREVRGKAVFGRLRAVLAIVMVLVPAVQGHGRLVEPPSRSSAWKFGFNTPVNSNDHQLSCGGYWNQWHVNNGKCGICGDPYQGPRDNEAGGAFATGTIVRHYREGQTIDVHLDITVGHGGWSEFRICPNNDVRKAASQTCLNQHLLATSSGVTRITLPHLSGFYQYKLKLPRGLTCSQCVLQWRWTTGSNNNCNYITKENCCDGCGQQEQFYGCADVSIASGSGIGIPLPRTTPRTTPRPRLTPRPTPRLTPRTTLMSIFHSIAVGYTRPGGFLPIDT